MSAVTEHIEAGEEPREVGIASGAAFTLAGQVVNMAASFIVGIVVARLLGPVGKGTLSVVMQVVSILLVVLNLGVGSANVYYVAKRRIAPGVAAGNSMALAVLLGLAGAPLVIVLLQGRFAVVQGIGTASVAFAVASVALGLLSGWLVAVASGLGDLKMSPVYAVVSSVTSLCGLGVLFLVGRIDIAGVMATSAIGIAAGIVAVFLATRRRLGLIRFDLGAARTMAVYSAKSHFAGIAGYLHNRQDVLILGWLAGASAVGLYSVGVSFAELLWYAPVALGAAVLAKAPRSEDASAEDYVARSTRVSVLLMLIVAAVAVPSVPLIIRFVYGRAFAPALLAFFVLLPGAFADGAVRPAWSFHAARERIYWIESLVATGLNIGLNLVLVPRWGFVGAAAASSVSYALLSAYVLGRFVQHTRVSAAELLVPTRSDVAITIRTIGSMARRLAGSSR